MGSMVAEFVKHPGFWRLSAVCDLCEVLQEVREPAPLERREGLNVGRLEQGQEGDGLLNYGHGTTSYADALFAPVLRGRCRS